MSLIEVRLEVAPQFASSIDEYLLESESAEWSVMEDVILKRAWLVGIFQDHAQATLKTDALLRALPCKPLSEASVKRLEDADWKESYKAHFKAWQFGRLHWVPVWEKGSFRLPAGDVVLWLDPGLAFGTGNHETTRLCIEYLVLHSLTLGAARIAAARVVDAGCGSGILALSASLLGYGSVDGFDNDPEAVRVSIENAALNDLAGRVHFHADDLVSGLSPGAADVLLANIQSDVLLKFRQGLLNAVAPGGVLILSGILSSEIEAVAKGFSEAAPQWTLQTRVMGEWSAALLARPL